MLSRSGLMQPLVHTGPKLPVPPTWCVHATSAQTSPNSGGPRAAVSGATSSTLALGQHLCELNCSIFPEVIVVDSVERQTKAHSHKCVRGPPQLQLCHTSTKKSLTTWSCGGSLGLELCRAGRRARANTCCNTLTVKTFLRYLLARRRGVPTLFTPSKSLSLNR